MKYFLTNELFVAYSKLKDGTLEIFGSTFGNEATKENIMFLQKLTSNLRIQSVVFKWFHFNDEMLRIFDVFHEKLQNSVKSITFERCYFPESFILKGSLELNHVTEISFIQSFANEESFKEMFKVFKNALVTSLTILGVLNYKQNEFIDTSAAIKKIFIRNIETITMKINDLKLEYSFPISSFFHYQILHSILINFLCHC